MPDESTSALDGFLKGKPRQFAAAARLLKDRVSVVDAILEDACPNIDPISRAKLWDDLMDHLLVAECDLEAQRKAKRNGILLEGLMESWPEIMDLISRLTSTDRTKQPLYGRLLCGVMAGLDAFRGERKEPEESVLDLGLKILGSMRPHISHMNRADFEET